MTFPKGTSNVINDVSRSVRLIYQKVNSIFFVAFYIHLCVLHEKRNGQTQFRIFTDRKRKEKDLFIFPMNGSKSNNLDVNTVMGNFKTTHKKNIGKP